MFERAALIHFHEIGLKGRNRALFERRLAANIRAALAALPAGEVDRFASRIMVGVPDPAHADAILAAVARIPGVAHVSDAYVTGRDPAEMERAAVAVARAVGPAHTFAVDARRSATDHPESSREMNVRIGEAVRTATGMGVDLGFPDVKVRVEVVQGRTFVHARRLPGPGGLPVGTSGRVVALLSAGIDSPVAAWRLMKRGAVVVGVHFSGQPYTSDMSSHLVMRIGEVLSTSGGLAAVEVVRFGDLQREISLACPPELSVVLYRRLMIRVAETIAAKEGAKALATGECLGQVASQTLENVAAIDEAATLPVLRPLIGMDKIEIIAEARRLGTFELSTERHDDCCTLFVPRNPATRANVEQVREAERALDVDRMVSEAVAAATRTAFPCPAYRSAR